MQSTVTQGNQAQVLIRSIGEWSSRFFADKVEMPEELGHWRHRGKERWHFVLTEAGQVQAEVLRNLYETADQSWLVYRREHQMGCLASIYRDGFANGVATTGVELRRAGRLREVTNAWICEDCEAIFIGEHFSTDDCNRTGLGITLCLASGLEMKTDVDWSLPESEEYVAGYANIGGGTVGFCDRGEWTPAQLRALATLAENSVAK